MVSKNTCTDISQRNDVARQIMHNTTTQTEQCIMSDTGAYLSARIQHCQHVIKLPACDGCQTVVWSFRQLQKYNTTIMTPSCQTLKKNVSSNTILQTPNERNTVCSAKQKSVPTLVPCFGKDMYLFTNVATFFLKRSPF